MPGKKTWMAGLALPLVALAVAVCVRVDHHAAHRQAAAINPVPPRQATRSVVQTQPATAGSTLATYQNDRFNFVVDYPAQLLVAGQEADNGDGLRFTPKSGDADIRAWGEYNVNDDAPAAILQSNLKNDCAKGKVSFQVSKPNLVAYSCLSPQGRIVYEKVVIRDDTLASVRFEYDPAAQAAWAQAIKQMAGSLRLGPSPTYQEAR